MDKSTWLMVAMFIGGLIATASRDLFIEFLKQFVPQLDQVQKANAIKSVKRLVRTFICVFWGALMGVFVASSFFSKEVTRTVEVTEGFLVNGSPPAPLAREEVATGERMFTSLGYITIVVFGIGGGLIGFLKQTASEMNEAGSPPASSST